MRIGLKTPGFQEGRTPLPTYQGPIGRPAQILTITITETRVSGLLACPLRGRFRFPQETAATVRHRLYGRPCLAGRPLRGLPPAAVQRRT